jgi:hypothetical protein
MRYFRSFEQFLSLNERMEDDILNYVLRLTSSQDKLVDKHLTEVIENQISIILPFLKELLRKNPGYIVPFAKMYFNTHQSPTEMKETYDSLYQMLIRYKQLLNYLPKPVIEYNDCEELNDDLTRLEIRQKAKSIENELVSDLKKQLKESTPEFQYAFNDLASKLYDRADKKSFLSSLSKYKDINDLVEHMEIFVGNEFTYSTLLHKIEATPGARLFQADETLGRLIAKIDTYEASKALGAPSWCIVTGEGFWKQYNSITKMSQQYFIWNTKRDLTDPNFLIGVTVQLSKGKIVYKEICDKNNNGLTSNDMFKVCNLKRGSLPAPSEEDLKSKIKKEDIEGYKLQDFLKLFVENNCFDLFKLYLPKGKNLNGILYINIFSSVIKSGRIEFFIYLLDLLKTKYSVDIDNRFLTNIRNHVVSQLNYLFLDELRKYYPFLEIDAMAIPYNKLKITDIDKLLSYCKREKGDHDQYENSSKESILATIAIQSIDNKGNIELLKAVLDRGFNPLTFTNIDIFDEALQVSNMKAITVILNSFVVNGELLHNILFYWNNAYNRIEQLIKILNLSKEDFIKYATEAANIELNRIKNNSKQKLYGTERPHLRSIIEQLTRVYGREIAELPFKTLTDFIAKGFDKN